MPVTEAPLIDERTALVDWLVDFVRGDDSAYRALHEQQVAEAAARETRREWARRAGSSKKPKRPGSRPWQRGFKTKQAWLDHNQAHPQDDQSTEPATEV